MPTGTVKWFNAAKGYGFIECPELNKDIFIHFKGIAGEGYKILNASDKVEFDIEEGNGADEAVNAYLRLFSFEYPCNKTSRKINSR